MRYWSFGRVLAGDVYGNEMILQEHFGYGRLTPTYNQSSPSSVLNHFLHWSPLTHAQFITSCCASMLSNSLCWTVQKRGADLRLALRPQSLHWTHSRCCSLASRLQPWRLPPWRQRPWQRCSWRLQLAQSFCWLHLAGRICPQASAAS